MLLLYSLTETQEEMKVCLTEGKKDEEQLTDKKDEEERKKKEETTRKKRKIRSVGM